MPSVARDESRDRELVLKHHPSVSDSGRASVPMYALSPFAYFLYELKGLEFGWRTCEKMNCGSDEADKSLWKTQVG